jgi:hypothetical protein
VLFGLYERRNGQEYDVDFVKGLIFLGRACSWLCGAGAAPKPLATVSGGSVVPCPFAADLLCKPFAIDRSGYLSGSTANLVARHIHVPHAASLPLTGEHSWQTRCTAEAVLSDSRDLTCAAQLLSRCTVASVACFALPLPVHSAQLLRRRVNSLCALLCALHSQAETYPYNVNAFRVIMCTGTCAAEHPMPVDTTAEAHSTWRCRDMQTHQAAVYVWKYSRVHPIRKPWERTHGCCQPQVLQYTIQSL